jgi:AcrR family transcriptional regulator
MSDVTIDPGATAGTPDDQVEPAVSLPPAARERIIDAAYDLFSRHGVRAVGVDAVIARSGVAKMTLYRHFASEEELVIAFLKEREERWTKSWLQGDVQARARSAGDRLLAVFDVFDGWFRQADFEGCSFINVLLETPDAASRVHQAANEHLANIRLFLRGLAEEAGVADPDGLARQWHILMKGSIVAAGEGDAEAARRAQAIGRLLLQANGVPH